MEEQFYENAVQFSALPNWMGKDIYGMVGNQWEGDPTMMASGSSEIPPVPVWNNQWMRHPQQTPQNYFQFLGENAYPGIMQPQTPEDYAQFLGETGYPGNMNKAPGDFSAETPTLGLLSSSQQEQYLMPHGQGNMISNYSNMEHQFSIKKENWNKDYGSALQTYAGSDATAAKRFSALRTRKPRDQKAYIADRNRRLRISKSLDALQELLPHFNEANKEAFLGNVIGHVQRLQYQLKDLSRSRLGGESTSDTYMFLKEQMHNKPLEDMVEDLFKSNPAAATELLHRQGLLVLPISLAEGLQDPTDMLDMQAGRTDANLNANAL